MIGLLNCIEKPASDLVRRGDASQCPVCGSQVSPEAYHCPKCHSYFCFHCRVRFSDRETQLQCTNQACNYYGKLVCGQCEPVAEKEDPPVVYFEPEDGYWPAWLAIALLLAAVTWYFTSFLAAVGTAIVFAAGGYLLHRAGLNLFGIERRVEHPRRSSFHECIRCKASVKEIRGVAKR
jgi:hypothetical protein